MSASSVSGTGPGPSNKANFTDLANAANGPQIIFTGYAEATESVSSPPGLTNTVKFPYPLPGGSSKYVVMLTSQNAGTVYVADMIEDEDENFTGFGFTPETEGQVMYLVSKVGIKPLA